MRANTYVLFTNLEGSYYLEAVSAAKINELENEWDVQKIMDNVQEWSEVQNELNNPTIQNGSQLVVLQPCYS